MLFYLLVFLNIINFKHIIQLGWVISANCIRFIDILTLLKNLAYQKQAVENANCVLDFPFFKFETIFMKNHPFYDIF